MAGFAQASLGYTLMEMLIAMAIAAILLGLAVPSFRYVTNSNRVAGEINGLLGDLQFARAEAIKEGRTVTVCVSADGLACTASISWKQGWIVFSDPNDNAIVDGPSETILRVQSALSGTDDFSSNGITSVTFNREGYAEGIADGTLITLHTSPANTSWTRCLTINLVGQVATEMVTGALINGSTCT